MRGYKFNRQKPLDRYIVDFYCKKLDLVIEIDGESHNSEVAKIKDTERQLALEKMGLYFLRFDDLDVKKNMLFVLTQIQVFIDK